MISTNISLAAQDDDYYCPASKSDSDFMFCLQSYQGLIIDRSLSIRVSSSEVYTFEFYLAILNKV